MAPLQAALGASRVGSCISSGAKAAAPRVLATPLGRRAPTTDAVAVAAASASASSSSQHPSETRLTRPEHGGRQLDSPGSSSQVRRRSRRRGGRSAGRNDGAAVASLSASASAPSFEQAEAALGERSSSNISSASEEASGSPSASLSDPEGEFYCRCELAVLWKTQSSWEMREVKLECCKRQAARRRLA